MVKNAKCPRCRQDLDVKNAHWIDPFVVCKNKNCSEKGQLKRKSKVVRNVQYSD